ncbi:MAG: DUF2867 domain-containing protein [Fimbriimonadales bacterium]|nr:DUF2867 domain-containing protein [Fimbriimonadales bacterium]
MPAERPNFGYNPRGLPGVLYWYALYPIHRVIFSDMARALAQRAESAQTAENG